MKTLNAIFEKSSLRRKDLAPTPAEQFARWFGEAKESGGEEAHIMTLATVCEKGRPHNRVILLKDFSQGTYTFYTNYQSSKAHQLTEQHYGALTFFWSSLGRQVRIEGRVEKLPRKESEAYFKTRPRSSQLGAWASEQSRPVIDRRELERVFSEYEAKFLGAEIPCPAHWGGYVLTADKYDFWQGREARMHDRFVSFFEEEKWVWQRLCP